MPDYPAIPEPVADVNNLAEVARSLKEAVEILSGQRGEQALRAVNFGEISNGTVSVVANATNADFLSGKSLDFIFDKANQDAEALVTSAENDLQAAIAEVQSGYQSADAVLQSSITSLSTTVNGNTAAITSESIARSNGDTALGARIDTVSAVSTGAKTYVQSTPPTATAVGEFWIDTANANLLKRWNGIAWVNENFSNLGVMAAAIGTENITRVNADSALSVRIDTVQSQTNQNTASISSIQTAYTTADTALSTRIDSVQAQTDAGTANGFFRMTALSNPGDGAAAEFMAQVKAFSGSAFANAGMRIQAFSNGTSRVKFNADQFIVTNGVDSYVPFAISSGQLIAQAIIASSNISGAIPSSQVSGLGLMAFVNKIQSWNIATYIDYGVISNAFIGDAQISAAKIIDGNITNAKIQDGAITNAKIADAQITNAKIADGQITTAKIGVAQIDSARIADLVVGNEKITGNAVSNTASGATGGSTLDLYLYCRSGARVVVTASVSGSTVSASSPYLEIQFNGGQIAYTGRNTYVYGTYTDGPDGPDRPLYGTMQAALTGATTAPWTGTFLVRIVATGGGNIGAYTLELSK